MDSGHQPPPFITKKACECPFCGRRNDKLNDLTLNENDPHGLSWTTKCPTISCGNVYWICTLCLNQPIFKKEKDFKKHRKSCVDDNLKHKEERLRFQREGRKKTSAKNTPTLPTKANEKGKKNSEKSTRSEEGVQSQCPSQDSEGRRKTATTTKETSINT